MRKTESALIIPVQVLADEARTFSFLEKAGLFPELAKVGRQGDVFFPLGIEIEIALCRVDEIYRGEGTIKTQVELQCGRCLEMFMFPLEIDFSVNFQKVSGMLGGSDEAPEQEMEPEEADLIPFSGEGLDLTEVVQEQILMAIPVRPLCREDCLGLCPICGVDRNRYPCTCADKTLNPQWRILAGLKIDEKGH